MKIYKLVILLLFGLLLLSEECKDNKIVSADFAPNPASDQIVLTLTLSEDLLLNIDIYDVNGMPVLQPIQQKQCQTGENRIEIQTNTLNPGVYFCRIQGELSQKTEKFVIVR
ncbi:MAG: hypothetical protein HW421_417 [Ignavibacteria bacterium]|nr:hypothetical protein [Ignavibacteria bacterium]